MVQSLSSIRAHGPEQCRLPTLASLSPRLIDVRSRSPPVMFTLAFRRRTAAILVFFNTAPTSLVFRRRRSPFSHAAPPAAHTCVHPRPAPFFPSTLRATEGSRKGLERRQVRPCCRGPTAPHHAPSRGLLPLTPPRRERPNITRREDERCAVAILKARARSRSSAGRAHEPDAAGVEL